MIKIQIPSLNESPEDIIPLPKFFLLRFNKKFGKKFIGFTPQAERALMNYHWVGNGRELKNMIERAVLTSKGLELTHKDLRIEELGSSNVESQLNTNEDIHPIPSERIDLSSILESIERTYIQAALRMAEGNENKAARLLNFNHHTFHYRRRKLLIP